MSSTFTDSVRSVFTEPVLSKFAVLLGETEGNIQKAVHGVIAIVTTDILHKSYFPEGISRVRDLARQAAASDFHGDLHELSVGAGGLVAGSALLNKGTDFAKSLLGTRTDIVDREVSRYSGTSISSAAFITGMAAFAALDTCGRHIVNSKVDANGLGAWLKSEGDIVMHTIPMGLQVKPALGIERYPWEQPARRRGNTILYVILLLVILAAAAYYYFYYWRPQHPDATALLYHLSSKRFSFIWPVWHIRNVQPATPVYLLASSTV